MRIEVFADADAVARAGAAVIASRARTDVRARGRFVMALSGGTTPLPMFRALAREDVPWEAVHIVQVDERIAPPGHADRNLTNLQQYLLDHVAIHRTQIHPMPVESPDLDQAAHGYAEELRATAGAPPVVDLTHLGIGADGHTASLLPGDPAVHVARSDVALTGAYDRRRRMTLTYPILNRSRHILWIVSGREKSEPLARLLAGDRSIPAGRVLRTHALVLADCAAARQPEPSGVRDVLP
jgi:6-phosphogluconolactonase